MPQTPERPRRPLLLIAVVVFVVLLVFQRASYSLRLAAMELRYGGMFVLLLGLFIWILIKAGPRDPS